MEKRFFFVALSFFLIGLAFVACKQEPQSFLFAYTMESVGNYKLKVLFDSDKNYKIEEYNYFMDNQANKRDPKIKEGVLTDEDFAQIKAAIFEAGLLKMKDAYGFDDDKSSALGEVIYQIYFSCDGKEKHITIDGGKDLKFPLPFLKLIDRTNDFLNTYKLKLN